MVDSFGYTASFIPYLIFAIVSIVQVITVNFLPETLGQPMMTSIEEAEIFYAKSRWFEKRFP